MSVLRRRLMMANQGESPLKFYDELVFDGTAYIDTDYVFPTNCSIVAAFGNETLKAAQRVFMAYDGNGYIGLLLGGATNTTRRQILPYYDNSTYIVSNRYLNFTYTEYTFFLTPYRYGWGNNSYTFTKGSKHPTTPVSFGHYSISGQPYTGTMTTFSVHSGATSSTNTADKVAALPTVATFRPCTYNGEAGLWHVETNTFYGNTAGSGTLSVR